MQLLIQNNNAITTKTYQILKELSYASKSLKKINRKKT